jgi:hypothetical protein
MTGLKTTYRGENPLNVLYLVCLRDFFGSLSRVGIKKFIKISNRKTKNTKNMFDFSK